ncbi:sialidase-like [Drosophila ficusphila]|uniref:sialidase-like n=1 Tax=Drosophila ficusphila TaxID=30025 RepID=UPI0007E76E6C|nr:sialidase-like [Drosophila ficusphila]
MLLNLERRSGALIVVLYLVLILATGDVDAKFKFRLGGRKSSSHSSHRSSSHSSHSSSSHSSPSHSYSSHSSPSQSYSSHSSPSHSYSSPSHSYSSHSDSGGLLGGLTFSRRHRYRGSHYNNRNRNHNSTTGAGNTYYNPETLPQGATYLPAGSSMPAGAVYYPQAPQKSSSGLGLGTGLVAGAVGGAILGHALTPTNTQVVGSSASSSGGHGSDTKIIVINNGPPGPVNTTDLGSGTTAMNAAGNPESVSPFLPVPPSYAAPPAPPTSEYPGLPVPPAPPVPSLDPLLPTPADPFTPLQPNETPIAPGTQGALESSGPLAASDAVVPSAPPDGPLICAPIKVTQPDPNNSTQTVEVEQIACYPAPPLPPDYEDISISGSQLAQRTLGHLTLIQSLGILVASYCFY